MRGVGMIARVNVSKCLAVGIDHLKSALDSISGPWRRESPHRERTSKDGMSAGRPHSYAVASASAERGRLRFRSSPLRREQSYKRSLAALNWVHEIGISKEARGQRAGFPRAAGDKETIGHRAGKAAARRNTKPTCRKNMASESQPGANLRPHPRPGACERLHACP